MGFLSDKVAWVRRELDRAPLDDASNLARADSMPPARPFAAALLERKPAFIAEVKRASPSAGEIADREPIEQARAYERGGAAAISVLTDGPDFGGSLADLRVVRTAVALPVLRKDFIVHPSQLIEARAAGADAVLLISTCLRESELEALLGVAGELGLGCLVEAFGEEDLERAIASGAEVVGVNARDLETLEVDPSRARSLVSLIPNDRISVLESGIATREDVLAAAAVGVSAILVGEVLMRAEDPEAKLRELSGEER